MTSENTFEDSYLLMRWSPLVHAKSATRAITKEANAAPDALRHMLQ
jgi:hypothetical protein